MVLKMLALSSCPNADEPLSPENELRRPASPEVDEPDPGVKMLRPSSMPPRPDSVAVGEARLCRAPGSADISSETVVCPVPAEGAAAWVPAADWAGIAPGLAICAGSVKEVSSLAAEEDAA